MAWAAAAQYQMATPSEAQGSQLSQDEIDKLQEIHELINIMFAELTTKLPQTAATSYMMPTMSPAPYTQQMFQYSWGVSPYMRMPGY
jgi:hypothetical protein